MLMMMMKTPRRESARRHTSTEKHTEKCKHWKVNCNNNNSPQSSIAEPLNTCCTSVIVIVRRRRRADWVIWDFTIVISSDHDSSYIYSVQRRACARDFSRSRNKTMEQAGLLCMKYPRQQRNMSEKNIVRERHISAKQKSIQLSCALRWQLFTVFFRTAAASTLHFDGRP